MKQSENKKAHTQKEKAPVGFEELLDRAFEDQDQVKKEKK